MPKPRARGGQPGNSNALKHGFYSRSFNTIENSDLETLSEGLQSEVNLLRVSMRKVFELANQNANATVDDWTKALNALTLGSRSVGHLLRLQSLLTGGGANEMTSAIFRMLAEVQNKLG
jgi:hypothetical protein